MPDAPPNLSRLRFRIGAGWCYIVFGVLVVACVGLYYLGEQDFMAHAVHTGGTVVGNEHSISTGKSHDDQYLTIFTFADATGKTWKATDGGTHYHSSPAKVGQACKIIYNPDHPAEAELERPDTFLGNMGLGVVFGPIGLIMVAYGIFVVRSGRALLRRQFAAGDPAPRDPAILEGP